jgi:hypothetical protein
MSVKPVSTASLFDVDAKGLNESYAEALVEELPVSGDAWLRSKAKAVRAGLSWDRPGCVVDMALTELPADYSRERRAYADEVPC